MLIVHDMFRTIQQGHFRGGKSMNDSKITIYKEDLLRFLAEKYSEQKLDYVNFYFVDENTHTRTNHKIYLKTDGNKIADVKGNTWLHLAAESGSEEMLQGFIEKGGKELDLEVRNYNDYTPLMVALKANRQKAVEILVDARACLHARTKENGSSVLHICAAEADSQILAYLILKGGKTLDLDVTDHKSDTPLHLAIRAGKKKNAELLINAGADLAVNDRGNFLHPATCIGDTQTLNLLLDKGVQVTVGSYTISLGGNVKTITNVTPLFGASIAGDEEMIRRLVCAGDDPHCLFDDNLNLMHFAIRNQKVCQILLEEYKVNPNQLSDDGLTPILRADDSEVLTLLLKNGARPNDVDKYGNSPLHHSSYKNPDNVVVLLNFGANPNLKNRSGDTPFKMFVKGWLFTEKEHSSRVFELTKLFLDKGGAIDYEMKERFDSSEIVKNNPAFKKLINEHFSNCVLM